MEILHGGCVAPPGLRGGALALGNFDGVHAGHQGVIAAAIAAARAAGRPALAATFDPHPSRHFRPDAAPFALTTLDQKLRLFERLGLDAAVVIPFDEALAGLDPQAFAREWLAARLGIAHVVTGSDFTFGHGRAGDAELLAALGVGLGFSAHAIAPVRVGGSEVSSTRVRAALAGGRIGEVTTLLTRPFAIEGVVIHGDKRGRTIGTPTANIELGPYQRPRYGVYAVRSRLPDGSVVPGVASIGVRPMFVPLRELLEVWLFDWSGDLYGRSLETDLIAFLRDELVFDGIEALKAQIARDAAEARGILGA
jgi:riboflavin kinase/FMN adenylyltransferase